MSDRYAALLARVEAAENSLEHNLAGVFIASGAKPPEGEVTRERLASKAIEAVRQQRLRLEEAEDIIGKFKGHLSCWCGASWKPELLGHTDTCKRITWFTERKAK